MKFIEVTHKDLEGATTVSSINLDQVRRYSADSEGKVVFYYLDGNRFCSEESYADIKKRANEPDETDRFYLIVMNKLANTLTASLKEEVAR